MHAFFSNKDFFAICLFAYEKVNCDDNTLFCYWDNCSRQSISFYHSRGSLCPSSRSRAACSTSVRNRNKSDRALIVKSQFFKPCLSLQASLCLVSVLPAIQYAHKMVSLTYQINYLPAPWSWLTHVLSFSVLAASSIANIVKSSLGPVGLDKMLVDDVGVSLTFLLC